MTRHTSISLIAALSLAACGGGDGGGDAPQPQPQTQAVAFAQSGPLYKFIDDATYSNAASGGSGSGAITYTSSAPSVATVVSSTGAVTIHAVGFTQITATKAADASYLSASTSYMLSIAPRSVGITAWIGSLDADVTLSSEASALEFAKTSDLACDPKDFASCADGSVAKLNSISFSDPVAKLSRKAAYSLKHGSNFTAAIAIPENRFEFPFSQEAAVFEGRLWVIAGTNFPPGQIWSSADGLNWRKESDTAPVRYGARLLAFNGALWLLSAGENPVGKSNEVWRSTDGKLWSRIAQTAPYPARGFFAAAVFNGRLWISGGTGDQPSNDVWSSIDGASWALATSAAFLQREQHDMISFGGRMWIIGGYDSGVMFPDVWSSANGVTWRQETAAADFGPRFGHRVVADSNTMWMIGGSDEYQSAHGDVWSSTDGKSWNRLTDAAEFGPYGYPIAASWKAQLWVMDFYGRVWSSSTGAEWTKQSTAAVFPGRSAAVSSIAFKDRLWVLDEMLQLWSTIDGMSWTKEVVPSFGNIIGTGRSQLLSFNGKLFLVGGLQYEAPNYFLEMWQSADGRNWAKVTNSLPLTIGLSQVIPFAGKLWAFGGTVMDSYAAELWSSTDGTNWTRVSSVGATFGQLAVPRLVVFNNKLWAIGGAAPSGDKNDVLSTQDGVTWIKTPGTTGLLPGAYGSAIMINNQICIYDLNSALSLHHSMWCSATGQTWEKKSDDVPQGPIAALNGTLFMIGSSVSRSYINDLVWKSTDGISWRVGYRNSFQFPN